jgi:hypothetical protein
MAHLTSRLTRALALTVAAVGVGTVGATGACAPHVQASAATPAPVLRTYDVPQSVLNDVASTLNNLMYRGEGQPKVGSVGVAPGGALLVSAPAEFHPGVQALVERMAKEKALSPPGLRLDVWLVTGTAADAATPGKNVSVEIADVVDELQKVQGPMTLELLERSQLTMTSGSNASADGLEFGVDSQATLSGDGVLLDLHLRRRNASDGGRLNVRTVLPVDKTTVLGQVGAVGSRAFDKEPSAATAFYVVRATRLNP